MATGNSPTATLSIKKLEAFAVEIEPLTATGQPLATATAQRIETICERYGLVFVDASTQETQCR